MSAELGIKLTAGLTLKALIWSQTRSYRWNGTSLVLPSTIEDLDWPTGMISMNELFSKDGTSTNRYAGSFPAAITTPGEYEIEYFEGASPTPDQARVGLQGITWDGEKVVSVAEIGTIELVIDPDDLRAALGSIDIPNKRIVLGPAQEIAGCSRVVVGPCRDSAEIGITRVNGVVKIVRQ